MNTPDMRIRLQHVTVRRNKDKSLRYYFFRRGHPLFRLPDDPTSPEFMAAYQERKNWRGPIGVSVEGTFGWLCDQYMDSAEFKGKAEATRTARKRILLSIVAEKLDPKHSERFGQERITRITPRHICVLRDRKATNPNAANERLKVLSQVFKLAIARNWRDDNPVRDVERLSVKDGGHETATDEQIDAYFAKHTRGPAYKAMVLLTSFGMRVSDLRVIGPQHVRKGLLTFVTVKTGVLCELTLSAAARAVMGDCKDMVFLTSDHEAAYRSDKALSQRVAKWFRQAGVEGVTAHGVRKWLATRMAENGATEYELMAWFGWKDPKEARPYIKAANRRKLAETAGRRMGNV